MVNKKMSVIDSYVNSVDVSNSSRLLLNHLRRTRGKTWNMDSYRIGGGQDKIPERRFRYLLYESKTPTLYREEVEFLTNLSGITLGQIFYLPDIEKINYDESVKGLIAILGKERIDEIKNMPDVKDPRRWIKSEYLLNLTFKCLEKYPIKRAA